MRTNGFVNSTKSQFLIVPAEFEVGSGILSFILQDCLHKGMSLSPYLLCRKVVVVLSTANPYFIYTQLGQENMLTLN